jgi:hypothetical protein
VENPGLRAFDDDPCFTPQVYGSWRDPQELKDSKMLTTIKIGDHL